jgi:hypothetical protein
MMVNVDCDHTKYLRNALVLLGGKWLRDPKWDGRRMSAGWDCVGVQICSVHHARVVCKGHSLAGRKQDCVWT